MRTVLVVDDDPVFRGLAVRMLIAAGFDVVGEAGTATEAMTAAEAAKPDAALVDVDLPDRNGIVLALELSRLPWRPRVLLTSVDFDAAGPEDVRRSGASAFIHKADLPNHELTALLAA
jgi:DNA-binding NarL/FixJ family response regulator